MIIIMTIIFSYCNYDKDDNNDHNKSMMFIISLLFMVLNFTLILSYLQQILIILTIIYKI